MLSHKYLPISVLVLTTAMALSVIPSTKHEPLSPEIATTKNEIPSMIRAFEKIDVSRFATHPVNSYEVKKENVVTGGVLLLKNVEFGVTGASKVTVGVNLEKEVNETLEFRIDSEKGKVISTMSLSKVAGSESMSVLNSSVVPVKGYHDLYVFYSGEVQASNVSWFQFEVSGPNPEEFYVLTSMSNGQAMSGNSPTNLVYQHTYIKPYNYGLHQMFNFVKTAVGSYLIKARHAGMYLEVYMHQFNETVFIMLNGRNVSTQAQEWYIDPAGQGSVKIMSRLSGRCISADPSNYLYQKSCLNETYQKWFLMPVC